MLTKGWLKAGLLCVLFADGMEVDTAAAEAGQFEDADVEHWGWVLLRPSTQYSTIFHTHSNSKAYYTDFVMKYNNFFQS